ncbi:MAG: hypothetical protein LUG16_06020 [Candidatus Gastranaerophilales bacterium]|nr:hypothetical protein [Candidatus Gastranaerophilales bacterium]
MKKITTTDDILNDRTLFTEQQAAKIRANIEKKAQKLWGGSRSNSGRKAKPKSEVLQFNRRLTEKENQFIDYARAHNLNYDDLMEG